MGWLNNAWVVGIATGIVSGLLVTWLLNVFISKKKDKVYQQRIASANREVILSVRAGIPEDNLPTKEVVDALIHSTARKYDVEPAELYQPKELSEELIKEVMDSSFLSQGKKIEYCAAILRLGTEDLLAVTEEREEPVYRITRERALTVEELEELRTNIQNKRRKINLFEQVITASIGILTGIYTLFFATKDPINGLEKELTHVVEVVAKPGAALLGVVLTFLALKLVIDQFYRIKVKKDDTNGNG